MERDAKGSQQATGAAMRVSFTARVREEGGESLDLELRSIRVFLVWAQIFLFFLFPIVL